MDLNEWADWEAEADERAWQAEAEAEWLAEAEAEIDEGQDFGEFLLGEF